MDPEQSEDRYVGILSQDSQKTVHVTETLYDLQQAMSKTTQIKWADAERKLAALGYYKQDY